jgi:hypothetical protein
LFLLSNFLRESKKASDKFIISLAIPFKSIKNFKKMKTQFCSIFNSLQKCVFEFVNNLVFWL